MLKVISLVLLSMIQIRFLADKSITYILWSRYRNTLVKEVRKFEKIDYKLQKCKLDIALLTSHAEPILKKNETSLSLYLFDWYLPYEIIFQYLLLLQL